PRRRSSLRMNGSAFAGRRPDRAAMPTRGIVFGRSRSGSGGALLIATDGGYLTGNTADAVDQG
ncbi:MAG TPA: hypothetical protein QGG16_06295, partial [Acidimicrobiales bacterium]|nr:hypothetical protein [Acidimicrobiales bacterium]